MLSTRTDANYWQNLTHQPNCAKTHLYSARVNSARVPQCALGQNGPMQWPNVNCAVQEYICTVQEPTEWKSGGLHLKRLPARVPVHSRARSNSRKESLENVLHSILWTQGGRFICNILPTHWSSADLLLDLLVGPDQTRQDQAF